MSSQVYASSAPEMAGAARMARVDYWPFLLGAGVLTSRILTRGTLYFADGPAEIRAITARTFVIQPPGYWLFLRTAWLFPNPVFGISLMNWFFFLAGDIRGSYASQLLAPVLVVELPVLHLRKRKLRFLTGQAATDFQRCPERFARHS